MLRRLICALFGHKKMSLTAFHHHLCPSRKGQGCTCINWFGSWRCDRCGVEK